MTTVSKPECTRLSAPGPSACNCQQPALSLSASMRVTWVSNTMAWASTSGCAQCLTSAFMPGAATQCASFGGRDEATTRPSSSSMRTVLALHGLTSAPLVERAFSKRASRTVKYCVPWSKPPNSLLRVAMRPPAPLLFSNTVTLCPICTRVRAQAMPAMPAPMTATRRGVVALRVRGTVFLRDSGLMSLFLWLLGHCKNRP